VIRDIEIKMNVSGSDVELAKKKVGLRDRDAKDRDIWFYEHVHGIGGRRALPLLNQHLIVRVRRSPKGPGDVTIKVRAEDLVLPDAFSAPEEGDGWKFKIEGDWAGDRRTAAASLGSDFDADHGGRSGAAPQLGDIVIDRQLDFLYQAAELPVDVRALRGLGPISAQSWSPSDRGFTLNGVDHEIAAERWHAGDLTFLELSLRVAAAEATEIQTAFVAFARDRGVPIGADQENKTRLMLRHLTEHNP
jgi:hypothetical protein